MDDMCCCACSEEEFDQGMEKIKEEVIKCIQLMDFKKEDKFWWLLLIYFIIQPSKTIFEGGSLSHNEHATDRAENA